MFPIKMPSKYCSFNCFALTRIMRYWIVSYWVARCSMLNVVFIPSASLVAFVLAFSSRMSPVDPDTLNTISRMDSSRIFTLVMGIRTLRESTEYVPPSFIGMTFHFQPLGLSRLGCTVERHKGGGCKDEESQGSRNTEHRCIQTHALQQYEFAKGKKCTSVLSSVGLRGGGREKSWRSWSSWIDEYGRANRIR